MDAWLLVLSLRRVIGSGRAAADNSENLESDAWLQGLVSEAHGGCPEIQLSPDSVKTCSGVYLSILALGINCLYYCL